MAESRARRYFVVKHDLRSFQGLPGSSGGQSGMSPPLRRSSIRFGEATVGSSSPTSRTKSSGSHGASSLGSTNVFGKPGLTKYLTTGEHPFGAKAGLKRRG